MSVLFNIAAVEASLIGFQSQFTAINDTLAMRREPCTELMIQQIVEAYEFLNSLLRKDMDLFTPAGLYAVLEMNHIVLCGSDEHRRAEYYQHLTETRAGFLKKIKPIKDYVLKKAGSDNPYKVATGFYSRMLSRPQLFLEGNHRTGNILLNYLLVSKNIAPYVVSHADARVYLDLSGDIKFTDKDNSLDSALRMPGHRKRFRAFLEAHVNEAFVVRH